MIVVKKKTGKVLFGVFGECNLQEDEILVNKNLLENFIEAYYNFETQEFYEGASKENVDLFHDKIRSQAILDAYEQRKSDGWKAYQDFRMEMVKEIYDSVITKQQAFIIESILEIGFDKIAQQGDWETAYYKLSQVIVPPTYPFVQSYLDKAKTIMLTYIQHNYKPM